MSIISFSAGVAEGDRKPEPSITQAGTPEFVVLSESLGGVAGAGDGFGDAVLAGADFRGTESTDSFRTKKNFQIKSVFKFLKKHNTTTKTTN